MQDFRTSRLHWDDLRLILAVRRAGSFAGAAGRLGISTPTVFRQAKSLEQRLGTLVFRRDNTGVSLTAAGLRSFIRVTWPLFSSSTCALSGP